MKWTVSVPLGKKRGEKKKALEINRNSKYNIISTIRKILIIQTQ